MSENIISRIDISSIVNHNTNFDISYIEYNRNNIPWKINTTYISQNNANINNGDFNSFFGNGELSNNLLIESLNNDIILATSENNKVKVTNNMEISNNLDVINTIKANDICLNNVLYLTEKTGANIIGNLTIQGSISQLGGVGVATAGSSFTNASLTSSKFIGTNTNRGKITLSDISDSSLNNVEISDSIIYNTLIGRNSDGSIINASSAAFSDIQLNTLRLNSNLGQGSDSTSIEFTNGIDNSIDNSIIITQANNYQELEITKHLNVGTSDTTGTSIFNGDISCNTLHYINLVPDICFNNYTDVSFGHFSISGNIIPTDVCFNIGSSSNKFNNIYSQTFIGDLSGNASTCSLASNLIRGLDMYFNNLTINGVTNSNSIIPNVDISSNLGTIEKKWKNAYIQDLSVNNNLDVSGNLKCNTIQIGNSSIGENDFNQGLDVSSLNAFTFTDISLTGNLLLDNSKNNYVFFQDISKTLHDNSGGLEIASSNIDSANNSRTFNVEQNFYYKIEISKQDNSSFASNNITFTYTYKDGTLKTYNLTSISSISTVDETQQNTNYFSQHDFFNDPKYPIIFLYINRATPLNILTIATQNSNLLSINISSTNNEFNIKLFKLYAKPKLLYINNSEFFIITENYYYNYSPQVLSINRRSSIFMNDLYYFDFDNVNDNSNNIRIGTGLLNNASNQILIGNYNETFDRSGNNVILGNSYCEAWLPPHGYTTDLGSSDYPFKNCYISENLDVSAITSNNLDVSAITSNILIINSNVGIGTTSPQSKLHVEGDITSNNIVPSTSNNSLGTSSNVWSDLYVNKINDLNIISQNNNVGIGKNSLANLSNGSNNIGIGLIAGFNLTTGFDNIYIGSLCLSSTGINNNEIVIGTNTIGNGTNTVTIGNDSIAKTILKGDVGIGTTSPDEKLDVSGNIKCNKLYFTNDIYLHVTNNKLAIFNSNISNDNNAYIATSYSQFNGFLGLPTAIFGGMYSDDRLKHNEENIISSLDLMRKLQPQTYDMTQEFKDADYTGTISGEYIHRAGFIAQEIRSIEEISYCCIGEEYDSSGNPTALAIDYNSIFTHGIAAIKELDNVVVNQQNTINVLNNKVTTLENENSTLKNELNVLKNALNQLLTANNMSNI